ncbi:ComEC/Rec2 family competence protein [Nitratireductor basaltis]|nr:ComEC/Rec2 family competence protein [Nitratireductor basaltis]
MAGLMRQEAARGTPFLFLPVLLAVGAAAYFALPEEPSGSAIIAVLLAKLCSLWLARSRPAASVIIAALLVFTMGMAAAKLETWRRSTPMLGSPIATTLTGQVRALEHMASGRMRLTLDVIATERPQLRYAPDRIRVSARQVPENLAPGDVIKGLVRLMPPSGPVRPGAYDFAFASFFQERGAVGFFLRDPEKLTLQAEPVLLRLQGVVQRLRRALSERILHHVQGQEGHIAVAMITGFRGGIPEETNEWLRRAGLAHILAISGLHMALAAGCVMIGLRWGFALFPQTASRLPVKKYAAAAALMLATLYLLISGGAVAAQRSYIMLAVMLVALLFDRAAITMRNLAIAALFITAASPHVVIGPSFQMSFAATAALIAAYSLWTGRQRRRGSNMPADHGVLRRALTSMLIFFAGLCATSIIAGLATTLFGAWHFQRTSPLALPANLAAMPLVSLVAMPSAVMAIITMPFGLDGLFWTLMGKAIQGIVIVAETIASHSPIDAIGLMPRSAFLLLAAGFTLLVIFTTGLRLLALPLLLAGAILWAQRELPDVLVSDDARLVGVYMGEGRLAVNRERLNGFTMGDWEHALMIESVIKPLQDNDGAEATSARGFSCREGACAIQHPSGAWIAHLNEPVQVAQWCGKAAIIILDDATVEPRCGARTLVLTKRDLARRGAASIQMDARATNGANVTYAVDMPYRPWHEHRRYSRAARGLAPYRRD